MEVDIGLVTLNYRQEKALDKDYGSSSLTFMFPSAEAPAAVLA